MICSGFGHSDCPGIKELLDQAIDQAISMGCDEFYCGLKGSFDLQFASAVKKAKAKHQNIKIYYISPYVLTKSKTYESYDEFDDIIIPALETTPPRFRISKRNEWIVRESDFIIFYINRSFGGANNAFQYAKRQNKPFTNLAKISLE